MGEWIETQVKMSFAEWWNKLHPAEVDELKSVFEECWKAGQEFERAEIWNDLNKMIVRGPLGGSGINKTSERNGIIQCTNKVFLRNSHG